MRQLKSPAFCVCTWELPFFAYSGLLFSIPSHETSLSGVLIFPPFFFTHNSVHVLASVAFRFHSALVRIQLCVRSSLPLCPSSSACMCVCLVGLNLVSEGRKFWGSCEHPLFSFCFNLFSLIFWGRIFFADLGSDQLELSALQLWLNCLSLNVQLRCYLAA